MLIGYERVIRIPLLSVIGSITENYYVVLRKIILRNLYIRLFTSVSGGRVRSLRLTIRIVGSYEI